MNDIINAKAYGFQNELDSRYRGEMQAILMSNVSVIKCNFSLNERFKKQCIDSYLPRKRD